MPNRVLGPLRRGRMRKQSSSWKTSRAPAQSQVVQSVQHRQHFSQHGTLTGVALGSYQIGGSTLRSVEKLKSKGKEMNDIEVSRRLAWKIFLKQVHQHAPKQQQVLQSKGL
mmetsp:Transcript_84958/g.197557  ORF Transcript_84958/g.197557 Transcript_84958/m.197557 type:complete len:111 (+) Transcript_84958:272-604(+)